MNYKILNLTKMNKWIFLIILLSILLRIINLNQSLWLDEATQAILSQGSIYSIISQRGVDFHPPLSYLITHFWMKIGTSDIWLRLLSVIFGVGTVWITYKLTKVLFDKNIALLSTILLAVSPYHIYYSQEIRMYSEAAFFAILSIYFLHLFLTKSKIVYSTGYILSTVALLYTHYDGSFLILAQLLYILNVYKKRLRDFILYQVVIFILYIPWIPQFITQLKNGLSVGEYLPGWQHVLSLPFIKALPVTFFKFSFGRIDIEDSLSFLILTVSILAIVVFVLFKSFKNFRDKKYKLVALWFFIPIISVLIISFRIPLNQPFRILYVLPAFCILLSLGIYNLKRFKLVALIILIFVNLGGLTLYYVNPKYSREDWRRASEFILKNINDDSQVIFAWSQPFPPYTWYANNRRGLGAVTKFPATKIEVEKKLIKIINKKDIYLFEYLQALSDPQKLVQEVIEEKGFKKSEVFDFRGVGFIDHYVK